MNKKQDVSTKKTKTATRRSGKKHSKVANSQVGAGDMTEDNKKTGSKAAARQLGISNELIGQTAGQVWKVLHDRGEQTHAGVKKSLDAPEDLVVLSIGWLARENKLVFEATGRSITISLRKG
jgi:hypothetical protein